MMKLADIVVLTSVGEVLIRKKYCQNATEDTSENFRHLLSEGKTSLQPHVVHHGIHYYHIKRQGLYFIASSKHEVCPIFVIEFLSKIYHLFKDFCGVVNEAAIHANMMLLLEVLDEVMDYGFVQLASTEKLKPYIQNEPVPVKPDNSPEVITPGLFGIEHRISGQSANKPVIRSRWDQEMRKNEIFLDVIERLTVVIAANGAITRCEVAGQLNMKSFLVGCPDIKIGLNEDLTIGKEESQRGYGVMTHLDECNFHETVKPEDFEDTKILAVRPPEGEFVLMSYSIHGDLSKGLPFRLFTFIEDSGTGRTVDITLKLRSDLPTVGQAINMNVNIPVPKVITGISQQLSGPGQSAEFKTNEKKIVWKIKKISGRDELTANFKLLSQGEMTPNKKQIGPIALEFELSDFVCSNLNIRFLRVFDREHSYVPFRWVRYVTVTDSYIFRL